MIASVTILMCRDFGPASFRTSVSQAAALNFRTGRDGFECLGECFIVVDDVIDPSASNLSRTDHELSTIEQSAPLSGFTITCES